MLTKEKREILIETIAYQVMEGMDYESMECYVIEQLSGYYSTLDNDELITEAEDYFQAPLNEII